MGCSIHEVPEQLRNLIEFSDAYEFVGSAGQGQWAKCPWVAVFDRLITDSVQSGYYVVYLFRQDMKGVYLSLNQGVTEIREKYKDNPMSVLKIRAMDFRAQIGDIPEEFSELSIDLSSSSKSDLSAYYEAGNIIASYYPKKNLPDEETLVSQLRQMVKIYDGLSYNDNINETEDESEVEEIKETKSIEDLKKYRYHRRIERNSKLSRMAKKIHGYTCQVCGFNFEDSYGEIGKDFTYY